MAVAVYFQTSYHRHNVITVRNIFTNKSISEMIKVQTHVQTAWESPDLNMDYRSFDNGCKQLYE